MWNRLLPIPNGLIKTLLEKHRFPPGKQEAMKLPYLHTVGEFVHLFKIIIEFIEVPLVNKTI